MSGVFESYRKAVRPFLSEINVTPLVDVMLVLLIIFMVTAPMLRQGVEVDLPKVVSPQLSKTEEVVVLSVTRRGEVFVDGKKVKLTQLEGVLRRKAPGRSLLFEADKSVPYGLVMKVMAVVRKAGIGGIGMVTELPEEGR